MPRVWGGTFVASGRLTESTVYRNLRYMYVIPVVPHEAVPEVSKK